MTCDQKYFTALLVELSSYSGIPSPGLNFETVAALQVKYF